MISKIVFLKFNTLKLLSVLILFLSFLFFSCVKPDINLTPFVNINNNVLVQTSELTSNIDYPDGSIITEIGLDQNNNNILDPEEITSTTISVINNNISNTLVLISDEDVGLNCENGGQVINTGEDINGNNILDIDEIISTQFVCNNNDNTPNLTIVSNEVSGSNCINGGVKIEKGTDSNLNQILDDSEIESTSFICDDETFIDSSSDSTIRGVVRDASTDLPLENVTITISNGQENITQTTDSSGVYIIQNISDQFTYEIKYELDGYLQVIRADIDITADTINFIETTLLITDNNINTGNIEGMISNAFTGIGEATVVLNIREGLGNNTGEIIATTTTLSNGNYSFNDLNAGNYTLEISKNGFITTYFSVQVFSDVTNENQNSPISPIIGENEIRIVLEWEQEPYDLDNHLTGPLDSGERFHAYFEDPFPINSNVILNVDAVNGFGPETITITETIDGVYRYSVHNFIGTTTPNSFITLENSSAIVKLYIGNTIQSFNVPSGSGNLWTVFEINGSDLTVTPINTITNIIDPTILQRGIVNQNDSHLIQNLPRRK